MKIWWVAYLLGTLILESFGKKKYCFDCIQIDIKMVVKMLENTDLLKIYENPSLGF